MSSDLETAEGGEDHRKTVGELTEHYADREQEIDERRELIGKLLAALAPVVTAITIFQDALPLGGGAISLVAAFVAVGGVAASLLIGTVFQDGSSKTDQSLPLAPSLEALRQELSAMRGPLLARSQARSPEDRG